MNPLHFDLYPQQLNATPPCPSAIPASLTKVVRTPTSTDSSCTACLPNTTRNTPTHPLRQRWPKVPIRKELRWLYPVDWPQLSRVLRFEHAGGRCRRCRRPHGQRVWQLPDGRWWDTAAETWRDDQGREAAWPHWRLLRQARRAQVALALAHRDHDPSHNRRCNLLVLCGRCHLAHDRAEHRRRRALTVRARRALGDLFEGHYRL